MRILAILLVAVLSIAGARSETLSAVDREALLEKLEKLRDAVNSKVDARFRMGISAYREALVSDEAVLALYLKCTEKVNFIDQQKKTSDYLDWKRQQHDKLAAPGFRLALHYQLRWLILTLQAFSEKANPLSLSSEAQEIVDALFRDADKLAGQEQELSQAVTSTIFARAYDIGHLEKDKDEEQWPLSPVNLGEIYGSVVFPPLRKPARVDALRAAWIKRIQQEGIKAEVLSGRGNGNVTKNNNPNNPNNKGKGERRIGMAADMKGPEHERFVTRTLPELQWQMEVDLFRSGDQSAAAKRMLAHIEKYINHRAVRRWGEEFSNLLKPKATTATLPPARSTQPETSDE
ncbi:MAG: hypothetical protein NTV46_14110 [Verrucomicrobia bacterium]|nr:hypothetical protein [Verrucomicrobiota bacterium]